MPSVDRLPSGVRLVELLTALGNAQRLRIIGALAGGQAQYVSQLARDLDISRPLLQVHLKKLAKAGVVVSRIEVSAEGKAMHFYELTPFAFELTPASLAAASRDLPPDSVNHPSTRRNQP